MSRDHARIRLDIWMDDDWRDLTSSAQWLYMFLLSSTSLSFAGVADWRPGRIAANAADLSRTDVEVFAAELIAGRFILVDTETEEVLVRSFVKHDGLMRSPNVAVAFTKAYAAIASPELRGVVVHELLRLQEAQPDLKGFDRAEVERVLQRRSITFEDGLKALRETLPETLRQTLAATLPEAPPEGDRGTLSGDPPNPSDTPSRNTSSTPNSLLPTPYSPLPRGAAAVTTGVDDESAPSRRTGRARAS